MTVFEQITMYLQWLLHNIVNVNAKFQRHRQLKA